MPYRARLSSSRRDRCSFHGVLRPRSLAFSNDGLPASLTSEPRPRLSEARGRGTRVALRVGCLPARPLRRPDSAQDPITELLALGLMPGRVRMPGPATYGAMGAASAPVKPSPGWPVCASLSLAVTAVLLPWFVFAASSWSLAFSLHYRHPETCWLILELCGVVVAVCGVAAGLSVQRKRCGDPCAAEPTMLVFTFVTLLVALVLGMRFGQDAYTGSMMLYYQITGMNTYPWVDPAKTSGQQVEDAGRIVFSRESMLGVPLSMGFTRGDTYCVAPIVSTDSQLASYDLWAIGVNCCTSGAADFHCGDTASARSGVRLLDARKEELFRLAVQKAEIVHGIQARKPLFFRWVEDPIHDMNAAGPSARAPVVCAGVFAHRSG